MEVNNMMHLLKKAKEGTMKEGRLVSLKYWLTIHKKVF